VINFVSNLPKNLRSGGFSALNVAAHSALSKVDRVHYVGPINPRSPLVERVMSKALRVAGGRGDFFFFSPGRLTAIASDVECACDREARLDFFHGFTPWIMTRPGRPYVALSDCTFRDYVTIYHDRTTFRARDLQRIEDAEAAWLKGAARVLFTTDWARERAIVDYGLAPSRTMSVGIFGEADAPARDEYAGEALFAFISTNFTEKGGPAVLAAFRKVRARRPGARLIVVGDRPSAQISANGVEFSGFLKKEDPEDYVRFKQILGRARALVHPTLSDIAPHVLVEAAYFGCPVITSRRYAIPEIVEHGMNGILVDEPRDEDVLAGAMLTMLHEGADYERMRRSSWRRAREQTSREGFEARVASSIADPLERRGGAPA
jgi:glycosyltransferase involved in cell wall biosynthesis